MTNSISQKLLYVAVFALSGITAAFGTVAVGSVLADNPKGSQAASQAVVLVALATASVGCLTLAAGAAIDD